MDLEKGWSGTAQRPQSHRPCPRPPPPRDPRPPVDGRGLGGRSDPGRPWPDDVRGAGTAVVATAEGEARLWHGRSRSSDKISCGAGVARVPTSRIYGARGALWRGLTTITWFRSDGCADDCYMTGLASRWGPARGSGTLGLLGEVTS